MKDRFKTSFKGVRYRKHPTRKHGVNYDQYFIIRYRLDGKDKEEGLGWASEGMTASDAFLRLTELKKNQKLAEGPQTLKEKRQILSEEKKEQAATRARLEKENITFRQYWDEKYFPAYSIGRKKDTIRKNREHFNKWIDPVIGNIPLKDIKPFTIEKIKKHILDDGKSARTLQYVLATLRHAWNTARLNGLVVGESPTKQIKIPKVDNKRVRFLNHKEAENLLEALKEKDKMTYEISLLSLHTGMRFGEIAKLKWGHVDTDKGTIDVVDPKGGTGRIAFMTAKVKAMFDGMTRGKHDDYIFQKPRKDKDVEQEPLKDTPREFAQVVDEIGLNKGITDKRRQIVFHSLRHTFASWHVTAGTDIYTLKELLGHSVIQMTERYSHLAPATLQNATQNIERAIKSAEEEKEKEQSGQVVNFPK